MIIVAHQAGALGVPMKVHTQKSIGKPVTASMDAYEKLRQVKAEGVSQLGTLSRGDADELMAGLDLRIDKLGERVDQGKATLEVMKETLDPRIAKLTELIPTTKEGGSEITHITKGQYRKVWGKEPPASIVTKGKVRWEYALDTIAQELHLESKAQTEGKNPDEYLKELIEDAKSQKELIRATQIEVSSDERTLKAIEKLKGSIKARIGKTTSDTLLHKLAKPTVKGKTRPEHKAEKMLASEAQALIDRIQAKRPARAVAIDRGLLAVEVVPMSKADIWGRHPNRLDIRGIDTPRRGRVVAGVAYADRAQRRLSRQHHRGWKRVTYT
jgi:hypothetical protein